MMRDESEADMQLAHFNWATLIADPGEPEVAEFMDAIGRVNAIAERSRGFVWRHGSEDRAGRRIGWPMFVDQPRMIASFSVWEGAEDLRAFVYRTVHGTFYRRSSEWFAPAGRPNHALWRVPVGSVPSIEEARTKVEALLRDGPSAEVFTFDEIVPASPTGA